MTDVSEQIAERRKDEAFAARLAASLERNRDILRRLAREDDDDNDE
jgi:hypothetical protein